MALVNKAKLVLYFLDEANVTEDDRAIAEAMPEHVEFINSRFVDPEAEVDPAVTGYVGVAGPSIPANWLAAYGKAADADLRAQYMAHKASADPAKDTFK